MSLKINNESEFNNLFNLHYEELCRIVMPIIHDKAIAEDIVQDVFVKLWIRRDELEINTTHKGYLYKSVVYRALDHLRKVKTNNKASEELRYSGISHHNNTDERVREKEVMDAINKGMDQMTDNMKVIFQLSRFSGLKNKEIAEELNISIKTVESNMGKALKIMHAYLAPFITHTPILLLYWMLCKL